LTPFSDAAALRYGWTISSSESNAHATKGTPSYGVTTLYLWLECCDPEGMAAAEFDLAGTGISILALTPVNNFLNAGGAATPLLAAGGCPCGPVVAAKLLVVDSAGSICFKPSVAMGVLGTVDCDPAPEIWQTDWVGYSNSGQDPCSQGRLCRSEFVQDKTWTEIKGLYRRR
jgi:hypothetical protein